MSDRSDDERHSRSRSQDSFDDDNNDARGVFSSGIGEGNARPQFSLTTLHNELGDEELKSFDVQNDVMIYVGGNGKIIIRDSKVDQQPIVALVPSAHKGFISPDGQHAFVSTIDGNLHYYSLHNRKAIAVQKVNQNTGAKQAMVVESVSWDASAHGQAVTTGTVLLGSKSGGLLFAAKVDISSSPASATFPFCRHVLQLPENDNSPIQSIQVIRNESTHCTSVLVTTASRMYPFVGKDRVTDRCHVPMSEEDVLKLYRNGKQCQLTDMGPKGNITKGTMAVVRPQGKTDAVSFAWLSVAGITHGLFAKNVSTSDSDMLAVDEQDDSDEGEDYDVIGNESAEIDAQFANQCHIPIGQRGVGSGFTPNTVQSMNSPSSPNAGASQLAQQRNRIPTTPPIDLAISAFHMFVLYENRMVVLGHPAGVSWRGATGELTDLDVSARIRYDPFEHRNVRSLIGIIRDEQTRKIFFYNKFTVFELSVEHEHLGQWKLFLEQAIDKDAERKFRIRCFEAAMKLSFGSATRRDLVTHAYGKFLLEIRAYQRAATMFAHCNRFEDIYMYLRSLRKPPILLDYVEKRYKFLLRFRDTKHNKDAMESQLICLLCVIIQLKLEAINRLEANPRHDKEELQGLLESLKHFTLTAVEAHEESIKKPAIYNTIGRLLTAHGRVDLMLAFSEKLGHVRYAIHFFISRGRYQEACKLLIDRCSVEGQEEAWYAFSPRLIQHCPTQLMQGMSAFRNSQGRRALEPSRLVPAFVHYRPSMNEVYNGRRTEDHRVIPYLRSCIRMDKNMDQLVHNFYVSLLAEYDVEALKVFLEQDDDIDNENYYSSSSDFGFSDGPQRTTAYDPEYALRQCIKFHRHQYCVPLYKRLGLYEDAIAIALEATRPKPKRSEGAPLEWDGLTTVTEEILNQKPKWMDPATFKELWLGVARRVIDKVGTRDTLSVVESSRGVLKLEDILPDIGDSTVIQDFKEAIVNSLNEYTESINKVKQKEEDAKRVSSSIKKEIETLQSRFGYVSSKQTCQLCQQGVFSGSGDRPFLVFPNCRHVFHEDCVLYKLEKIDAVNLLKEERDELPLGYLDGIHTNEQVAGLECVYCGECAIVEITAPMKEEQPSSWSIPKFR